MKLLHICRQYLPCLGGVERFVSELAERLVQRGHEVEVAALDSCFTEPGHRLARREVIGGVSITRLRYLGGPLAFAAPGVLPLARRAELLHIHNTDFFLDFLALTQTLHKRPFVVSTHGGYFHTSAYRRLKELNFRTLTRYSMSRAGLVIADSAADAARFGPIAPRLRRLENGLDTRRFDGVRKRIEPGLLLYHGRLAANKRVDLLLELLAELRRRGSHAGLILSGSGRPGELDALKARAARLEVADRVTFLGEVDERALLESLSRAHLIVSASTYEAFGLAVAEGMASGTVPLVNDIAAHRELVDEGVTGFLSDFADPPATAARVQEALSLPQEQIAAIGRAAKARIRRNDWENVLPVFEQIYAQAISRARTADG